MRSLPKKSEIRKFHIEATSKCNLSCPQCARSPGGFLNPILPMDELTIEDYKRIFDPDFCKQLDQIYFNGNYGDPCASSCLQEALLWLKGNGARQVNFFTNGSLRTPAWWTDTARILTGKHDYVAFSIDGLADTNHIYRKGANFDKIMENAQAFIDAGGYARWDFIKFKHNAHQVEEARELAKKMGFKKFVVKETARFLDESQGEIVHTQLINAESRAKKGTQADVNNFNLANLESGGQDTNVKKRFDDAVKAHGSFDNYVDECKIKCKVAEEANIFMDFQGHIWPCCWVGCLPYIYNENYVPKQQILKLIDKYGKGFNDTRTKTLDDILSHQWFEADLDASWQVSTKDASNPRLWTCGRTCGDKFEWSSGSLNKNAESSLLK